jgi:serine/threonine protein kinase
VFFQSPCILKNKKRIKGRPADVWALGVSLYCFAYLKHPFINNKDSDDLIE